MQFRLVFQGRLPSNGTSAQKQTIRRALHPQLRELWQHPPLDEFARGWLVDDPGFLNDLSVIHQVGDFRFATLVCEELKLLAELQIVMLRPTRVGGLIRAGGDIDNQLKTLFDALRAPQSLQEIPAGDTPGDQEDPFFCLLDDDERIANLTVAVDRYLDPPDDRSVHVDLFVSTRRVVGTYGNISLA